MADPALLDRLAHHRSLGGAPAGELAWLADHGSPRAFRAGEIVIRKGQAEEWLQIVFSGRLAIHLDRGAGSRKIVDWRGGDVCGLMPYSRGGSPPGDTIAEEPTDTLAIHRDHMTMMKRECPSVTETLVHAMLDRARHFTSSDFHDEKLFSLGKLASGLAHELNNPASAASRSAKLLAKGQAKADEAARALGAVRLSDPQRAAVDRLYAQCQSATVPSDRTPMERADREEAVSEWLTAHGLNDALAPMLAGADATPTALETLAGALTGDALNAALQWIAASCFVRELTADVETATSRIADLVSAVKSFTYMDRASTPESLDIRQGLIDTFAVLGAKAHAKSIAVTLTFAPDLPRVLAFGGELNQVWANLIDNALDAVAVSGHIDVTASCELGQVVVRIVDDGPGIPVEIQGRIFDPFFTTKKVGEGTGLGLDIVRRLVKRHDGEIDVQSERGRTEFRVSLPVHG